VLDPSHPGCLWRSTGPTVPAFVKLKYLVIPTHRETRICGHKRDLSPLREEGQCSSFGALGEKLILVLTQPHHSCWWATRGFIFVRNLQPRSVALSALLIPTIPPGKLLLATSPGSPLPESYTCPHMGRHASYTPMTKTNRVSSKNFNLETRTILTRSMVSLAIDDKEVGLETLWRTIENGSRAGLESACEH